MNHFYEFGYYLLYDFFKQEEVNLMYSDPTYLDDVFSIAQNRLEGLLDTELLANYHQGTTYKADDKVEATVLHAPCEIALTFTIAHSKDNWPIFLDTSKGEKKIHTNPGDALLFKGCDIFHHREPNTYNDLQIQHSMYWNNLNSQLGSFLRHFSQEDRCSFNFNMNEPEDNLPIWTN